MEHDARYIGWWIQDDLYLERERVINSSYILDDLSLSINTAHDYGNGSETVQLKVRI